MEEKPDKDLVLIELMMRLQTLEQLLTSKGILTIEEYSKELEKTATQITEKVFKK